MSPTRPGGLRERQKARTHQDLVDAAYALVREQGMAGVTAEAVSSRAGVSRRTFFNYFASVDSVLTDGVGDFFHSLGQGLTAAPGDEPVLDTLERLVSAPADPALVERIGVLGVVGLGSAEARAVIQGFLHDWLVWFTDHLRSRLPARTDDLYVVNLATAFVAAAEASIYLWAARTGGRLTDRSLAELQEILAASTHYLRTGFDRPPATTSKD